MRADFNYCTWKGLNVHDSSEDESRTLTYYRDITKTQGNYRELSAENKIQIFSNQNTLWKKWTYWSLDISSVIWHSQALGARAVSMDQWKWVGCVLAMLITSWETLSLLFL